MSDLFRVEANIDTYRILSAIVERQVFYARNLYDAANTPICSLEASLSIGRRSGLTTSVINIVKSGKYRAFIMTHSEQRTIELVKKYNVPAFIRSDDITNKIQGHRFREPVLLFIDSFSLISVSEVDSIREHFCQTVFACGGIPLIFYIG